MMGTVLRFWVSISCPTYLQSSTDIRVLIPFTRPSFLPGLAHCNKRNQQEHWDHISPCNFPTSFCFSSLHPKCNKIPVQLLNFRLCVWVLLALHEFQVILIAGLDPTPSLAMLHGLQSTKHSDLGSVMKIFGFHPSSALIKADGTGLGF